MSLLKIILGRRLANEEYAERKISAFEGLPAMGLDGLGSSSYGPEAAMTVLVPLGAAGTVYVGIVMLPILALLVILYLSYRQTIAAYPSGGGSYTVAKENLGPHVGLLAGAALAIDYILNVAVGISAGVGALVSAFPELLPHTLALCLAILGLIAVVNLRGIRESGLVFMVPTYAFVGALAIVIAVGLIRSIASGGAPEPVERPPATPAAVEVAGVWLLLKAFDRALFGMTGLETAVPLALDRLVRAGIISLAEMVAKLSLYPARVLQGSGRAGIDPLLGTLRHGAPADVTVLDPARPYRVERERLQSKSRNTPFDGWELVGAPVGTIAAGRRVMWDGELLSE